MLTIEPEGQFVRAFGPSFRQALRYQVDATGALLQVRFEG